MCFEQQDPVCPYWRNASSTDGKDFLRPSVSYNSLCLTPSVPAEKNLPVWGFLALGAVGDKTEDYHLRRDKS